ncbi:hypothetical protein GCM10014715_25550 [Streptomyces spiralis]|uniref:Uncharacterized protein n=1 Tax=Streptomyces spiralis TaxID=66376 RepID=A0A919DQ40_9ACTN|nr:hypothetical protein [Streptomyces spiralis]GHE70435.1 hypothetical protein GCM10014715_25550 [Streptomyces spiralis]
MSDSENSARRSGHSEPSGYSEQDVQREVTELEGKSATAARIFDLRRIIGGLFVLYGIIVTVTGITDSQAAIDKAQGVNINLWTGIGMLVLGVFFLVWLKLRPAAPSVPSAEEPMGE